jgi:phosphoserine phosphatase RsbU/P
LKYVNAGYLPPMVVRTSQGCIVRLDCGDTMVGLVSDVRYEQGVIELDEGGTLVAFTDGITEATNAADEEWARNN